MVNSREAEPASNKLFRFLLPGFGNVDTTNAGLWSTQEAFPACTDLAFAWLALIKKVRGRDDGPGVLIHTSKSQPAHVSPGTKPELVLDGDLPPLADAYKAYLGPSVQGLVSSFVANRPLGPSVRIPLRNGSGHDTSHLLYPNTAAMSPQGVLEALTLSVIGLGAGVRSR
jgi:hypothetical protein